MNRFRAAVFLAAVLVPIFAFGEPKELRVYHASFLRLGPNAGKVTAEERGSLFLQHLAYRRSLYQAGDLLMYGPLDGSEDASLRGLSIFRGDKPIEEIRRLVEADPYVKAGIMVSDVIPWLSEVPRFENGGYGTRRVDVPVP